MRGNKIKFLLKVLLLASTIILLISALAYIFRTQLLTGLAGFLVVEDRLQPADLIFVLNGNVNTRPFYASELFHQGFAPQIAIAQEELLPAVELGLYPDGTDVAVKVMKELGVPEENITVISVEGGVTSTYDEATVLRRYIEEHDIKRVILITSAFHTRRAHWIFQKQLADSAVTLQVAAAPQWKFDETNWWQKERGLRTFALEYVKLLYYFAVY